MERFNNSQETQYRAAIAEMLGAQAGNIVRRYFYGTGAAVETKKDGSPVTTADRECEQFLRSRIRTLYPDDSVIGEEFDSYEGRSPYTWVIDPIDGTKSFVAGVPLFTVLIAILYEGSPLSGVIHNPITAETVAATIGSGCTYNGTPAGVRQRDRLSDSLVLVTDPADLSRRSPDFSRALYEKSGEIRTWADGYGYLLVASGRADAMIDPIMNPWDVAAMKPVITEAGGTFSDFSGDDTGLGESAVAASPAVHREILEHLRPNSR